VSRRSKGARLHIRERPGRPAVYVILDGTREISTGCGPDNVAGANAKLAEYLGKTFRPDTRQRDLAAIPCSEVLMMYGRDVPADSPSRATIGYHIKALLTYWGDKFLSDVKGSTCRGYVSQRTSSKGGKASRGGSVAPATSRQELKTFQAAINHWHRESPLVAVPRVTLPESGSRRERVLERSEVARMLWAARKLKLPHVARFILIGIYTGTRHDAITKLRWRESMSGGHVDNGRSVLHRRGSHERETSKRRPPLRIPDRLRGFLTRWERIDAVFECTHVITYNGQSILKMKRAWHSVVKAAGLGPDVTPHVLRHTAASWLLWEGKTIWDVAGIIGADATTVQKVYGHHRKIDG
jgi:integrase